MKGRTIDFEDLSEDNVTKFEFEESDGIMKQESEDSYGLTLDLLEEDGYSI